MLVVVSQLLGAVQSVIEEKLFRTRMIDNIEATGIEGMAAFLVGALLLLIFNFVPCSPMVGSDGKIQFCQFSLVEDNVMAFRQIGGSAGLTGAVISFALATVVLSYVSTVMIKYGTTIQRAIVACLRPVGVWIVSVTLGWENVVVLQVRFRRNFRL